ncbi:MAG TPA: nuclear transport factor 2 family protein [Nitrososphaera sp.]
MSAKSAEEICRLFREYMAMGDIDSVLDIIYDHDVVFINQAGDARNGREALRQEIAPFAAVKAVFDFDIKQVIQAGDIALMHTEWKVSSPHHQISMYAIEVARRQSDGTWRWLIGDPFAVGRNKAGS